MARVQLERERVQPGDEHAALREQWEHRDARGISARVIAVVDGAPSQRSLEELATVPHGWSAWVDTQLAALTGRDREARRRATRRLLCVGGVAHLTVPGLAAALLSQLLRGKDGVVRKMISRGFLARVVAVAPDFRALVPDLVTLERGHIQWFEQWMRTFFAAGTADVDALLAHLPATRHRGARAADVLLRRGGEPSAVLGGLREDELAAALGFLAGPRARGRRRPLLAAARWAIDDQRALPAAANLVAALARDGSVGRLVSALSTRALADGEDLDNAVAALRAALDGGSAGPARAALQAISAGSARRGIRERAAYALAQHAIETTTWREVERALKHPDVAVRCGTLRALDDRCVWARRWISPGVLARVDALADDRDGTVRELVFVIERAPERHRYKRIAGPK